MTLSSSWAEKQCVPCVHCFTGKSQSRAYGKFNLEFLTSVSKDNHPVKIYNSVNKLINFLWLSLLQIQLIASPQSLVDSVWFFTGYKTTCLNVQPHPRLELHVLPMYLGTAISNSWQQLEQGPFPLLPETFFLSLQNLPPLFSQYSAQTSFLLGNRFFSAKHP